jgi:hypothetical protein
MIVPPLTPPSVALRAAKLARFFEKKRLEMRFTKFIPGVTLSKFENKIAPTRTLILTFVTSTCFLVFDFPMIKYSLK